MQPLNWDTASDSGSLRPANYSQYLKIRVSEKPPIKMSFRWSDHNCWARNAFQM